MTEASPEPRKRREITDQRKRREITDQQKEAMRLGREEAAKKRRRDREAEDAGLKLTNSAEIRAKQSERDRSGLDAVVQRHLDKDDDEEGTDDGEDLSAEEIAARTQVFNDEGEAYTMDDDELPADEPNPRDRDGATVGRIQKLREEDDDELRTLADLMAEYGQAIESGHAYIHVDRKHPPVFEHTRIKGVQTPIRHRMSQEEFNNYYGYGKYELIVYGPSERGGFKYNPGTGEPIYRKLTKPITIEIPASYPVNVAALFQEGDEYNEDNMQASAPTRMDRYRRTGATQADAKMHETELSFEERQAERERNAEKERQQQEEKRTREQQRMKDALVEQLSQSHEKQLEFAQAAFDRQLQQQQHFAEEQMRTMRAELDRLRQEVNHPRRSDGETLVTSLGQTLSQIVPALQRPEMTAEQRMEIERAAASDKERMEQRHRDEIERLSAQLRAADDRFRTAGDEERRRADERVDTERRRAEDRVRELTEQCAARVRDTEERARQQIDDTRRDCERRLADQKASYENRIQDIDRAHQAELRNREDNFTTRNESLRSTHAAEIQLKEKELERTKAELGDARKEAKRPLVDRLREHEELAEQMGFVKADESGEKDWKTMLPEMGLQLLQNVPGILETVKHTIDAKQRATLLQQQQSRQLAPPIVQQQQSPQNGFIQNRPLPFATEDGLPFDFPSESAPPPIYPNVQQQQQPGPSRRSVPMPTQQPPPPTYESAPQEPPMQTAPPPPPMQTAPPPPMQQPSPQQTAMQVSDENIVQYSSILKAAFEQNATPQEVANDMLQQVGPKMVEAIVAALDVERVIAVLSEREPENALLRRDGQRFLRETWELLAQVK